MCKKFKKLVGVACLVMLPKMLFAADYEMNFQSSSRDGDADHVLQKAWAEKIKTASGNRLEINVVPNGGIVGHNETLDAIRLGLLDGHILGAGYFADKDPAFALIGDVVGAWSSPSQLLDYAYEGGGNELLEKLFHPYGVHHIGTFTTELEAFVSKKPLDGVSDLKGLKMRAPEGLVTDVFRAAGAEPVNLPVPEIMPGLRKGVIDAMDYSVFSTNHKQGAHEIAKHPVYPGFHSMPTLVIQMGEEQWEALPADLQQLLLDSVRPFGEELTAEMRKRDKVAVDEAKKDESITIHDWSPKERNKFRAIAQQQWKVISEKSPNAKLVYDSVVKYLKNNKLL